MGTPTAKNGWARLCGLLPRALGRLSLIYRLHVRKDPSVLAWKRWVDDGGDATLRVDYPLTTESVVFDVGGYRGDWAARITERYDCRIYVFEPIPAFCAAIRARFAAHPKIRVFGTALSNSDGRTTMSLQEASSSAFTAARERVEVSLTDIAGFVSREGIGQVDLMKINIEGGEYALLERMLDVGIAALCKDIQVQFHDFVPGSEAWRDALRTRLRRSHDLTYDYYFVWENWRRRDT